MLRAIVAVVLLAGTALLTNTVRAADAYTADVKSQRLLKTQVDAAGRKVHYNTDKEPELSGILVEIPPGKETGWHFHTEPSMAYVMEGAVTVYWADGSKHVIKAGQAFAEVVNLKHNGRNEGKTTAKLIMFVAGSKDTPVAVKETK